VYWLVNGFVVEIERRSRSVWCVHNLGSLDLDILVGAFPYVQYITTREVKIVHEIVALIGQQLRLLVIVWQAHGRLLLDDCGAGLGKVGQLGFCGSSLLE
jgi:hypothetical protein